MPAHQQSAETYHYTIEGVAVTLDYFPFKETARWRVRVEGWVQFWAYGKSDGLVKARQHIQQRHASSPN